MTSRTAAMVSRVTSRCSPVCLHQQHTHIQHSFSSNLRYSRHTHSSRLLVTPPLQKCTAAFCRMPSPLAVTYKATRPYSSANSIYPQAPFQSPPPPQKRSLFRRVLSFTFRGWLYSILGFYMAAGVTYYIYIRPQLSGQFELVKLQMKLLEEKKIDELASTFVAPTDSEAEASLEKTKEILHYILDHPFVRDELEAPTDDSDDGKPRLAGDHPHIAMLPMMRRGNLTTGTLSRADLLTVPPLMWRDSEGKELVMITHTGKGLCGHPDIVHGGFVATMLDEGLARCCFKALPGGVGVTAYLNINYRAPTPGDGYVVLRATTTKVEGRKAWVTGRLETLPPAGSSESPKVLAEADALFVSPKYVGAMGSLAKSSLGI